MTTPDSKQTAVLEEAREMGTLVTELTSRATSDVRLKIQAALKIGTIIPENLEESLKDLEDGMEGLKPMLARLTPDETDLRKLGHDINNTLSVVIHNAHFVQEDMGHELRRSSDLIRLELIRSISFKLSALLSEISLAIQGQKTWEDITVTDLTNESGEIMPLNGKNFLIVDDDPSIAKVAGKKIVKAGGMYEFHNGEDAWPDQDFAVILLDHRLTGHKRGYELVDSLRAKYPTAQIIIHSADSHNAEEMKPYLGLPQIAKFAWTELNKLL